MNQRSKNSLTERGMQFGLSLSLLFLSAQTIAETGSAERAANPIAIAFFVAFVVATLGVSYWASKQTRSTGEFYNAGARITGTQNGLAIAGDFMSAASFLGITGLIFSFGYDGLIFAIGAFAGWPMLLFLLAKRIRNMGRYTFTDVISMRMERDKIRAVAVVGTISVVIMYLIAQMVGAGKLVELLFGLPYEIAVISVSALVIAYVTFGGMLATTWVQIIKAVLLLTGVTLIAILVLAQTDFSLNTLLTKAVESHSHGEAILSPGVLFDDPVQVATILLTMMCGVLGLPHILIRLFTVPDTRQAKRSIFVASLFMGYFYLALIFVGFGAVYLINQNPDFFSEGKLIGGNNMAAIHLANAVGGDILMGFMSAVAFATILAVVAGLTVAGTAAISHDLYAEIICKGKPDPKKELRLTRGTTVVIGVLAVMLGMLFQNENVAFLAVMPLVVAASVNFPILFASLFWPQATTRGTIIGAIVGLVSSIVLIVIGPQIWVSILGFEKPLFPYNYPGLFTMPLAFASIWLFSVTDRSERATVDRENYHKLLPRCEFGEAAPSRSTDS